MTLAAEIPVAVFQGNGSVTTFPIPFTFKSPAHLQVWRISNGLPVEIPPNFYTITPDGDGKGTITYRLAGVPLPVGQSLRIERAMPYSQEVSVENQTRFNPQVIQEGFDDRVLQIQQLAARVDALPQIFGANGEPLVAKPNKVLGLNENGLWTLLEPERGPPGPPGEWSVINNVVPFSFVGDGTATPFVLPISVPSNLQVMVYLDGLKLDHESFSAAGNFLTPFAPVPEGVKVTGYIMRPGTATTSNAADITTTSGLTAQAELNRRGIDFGSRAAAEAATIPAPVIMLNVLIQGQVMRFVEDPTGTALTTNSGLRTWSPASDAHVAHWGVEGSAATIDDDILISTIPTSDETTRLQAAMNWCLSNSKDLRADTGRVYGITSTLFWARTATVTPKGTPKLKDLNLCAIGGTWTAGNLSNADPELWTLGAPMLQVGRAFGSSGKYGMNVENITCNGNRLARTGVWFRANARTTNDLVKAFLCTDCQIRVGDRVDGSNSSCTDMVLKNANALEWLFTTDPLHGYNNLAARTSIGICNESSDVSFEACVGAVSRMSLVLRGEFFNCKFSGCTFFNGPVRTDPNSITAFIGKSANVYQFSNCRLDDGQVRVENFNGRFIGCTFIQFGSGHLRLVATAANETASRFVFVGNTLTTGPNEAIFETRGGSWLEFRGQATGNMGNTTFYTIGGVGAPRGVPVTVAVNQVVTVNMLRNAGVVTVTSGGADNSTTPRKRYSGQAWLGMGTTPDFASIWAGADFNVALGTLDGVDPARAGKVTIAPQADGSFQIENQGISGTLTFFITLQ